ncbi:40S ribosomal protein S15-like [Psammomys obesus]|uniref:40S ribosomal protein S15-like n=1 Tax=Psammomys obesus TaxID=48139 RepID=UPI002452FF34|nr:40S ribosomal protein S15-like [Psammomys obesus]
MAEVEQKKQAFHAFTNHSVDLDHVQQDMSYALLHPPEAEPELRPAQNSTYHLRKSKKAPPMEKPEMAKTYLSDMVVLPEMVGSMLGLYNGKTFNQVATKPEMINHYRGMFTITYKPFEAELACKPKSRKGPFLALSLFTNSGFQVQLDLMREDSGHPKGEDWQA